MATISVGAGGKVPRPSNTGLVPTEKPENMRLDNNKATKKWAARSPTTVAAMRRPKLAWRARDQENSTLYNLQLDVVDLQSELQGLRAYRQLLMSRALNRHDDRDGSLMRTAQEYFRVFRFGYSSDMDLHGQHRLALPQGNSRDSEDIATPDEFLRRVMDEHVWIGRFSGLAPMVQQWMRYATAFDPMTLSFLDSHIVPAFRGPRAGQELVLVISRARYQFSISMRTLEIMFPHILPHHDIVTKMLGRRIRGIEQFRFLFDISRKRIVQCSISLDLASSFTELLGDPAMVALLLNNALISDELFIGDLSDFVPASQPVPTSFVTGVAEVEPSEQAHPLTQETSASCSWKMTLSSILSAVDDDEDMEGEARGGNDTMDD